MNVKIILFSVSISTCALSMESGYGSQYLQQTQPTYQPHPQNPRDQNYYQKAPEQPGLYYQVPSLYAQERLNATLQLQLQISRQQLQVSQDVAQTRHNELQELKRTNQLFKTLLEENNNLLKITRVR